MRLSDISVSALALCALTVTGLVVRREFASSAEQTQTYTAPVYLAGWERLTGGGETLGRATAPDTIVVFSDFECPFCAQLAGRIHTLLSADSQRAWIVFHNFPITAIHPHAFPAAVAALCAARQSRFSRYHDELFAHQDSLGTTTWKAFAARADVPDLPSFMACLHDSTASNQVNKDVGLGDSIGVNGTPTVLIGGYRFLGLPSAHELDSALREPRRARLETGSDAEH